MDALIEFGKLLIPASVVLYAAYLLMRTFIQKDLDLKRLEVRGKAIETVLPNRLHAYERMTLFLERMSPHNLLVRLNTGSIPARDFQQMLLAEVRNEYNHNVSQQIYISEEVWELIKNAKEDLIVNINDAASEMGEQSTSLDLSKKIVEKSMGKAVDPLAHALAELKREVHKIF
ncbi:MAG TPA: hypothetical protein VFT90_07770 [Chryseosolibacter sp.]|nr:hypothetical protein [Chryseosolibacter sp.]